MRPNVGKCFVTNDHDRRRARTRARVFVQFFSFFTYSVFRWDGTSRHSHSGYKVLTARSLRSRWDFNVSASRHVKLIRRARGACSADMYMYIRQLGLYRGRTDARVAHDRA